LTGIVSTGGQVPAAFQGVVKAFTLNVSWASVEPAQGTFDYSIIDAKVATAASLGERILLRVEAGVQAPSWAQNIGGPPVIITDPQGGGGGPVGRWWTPAYEQAWADMEANLGARYDSNPTIGKVTDCEGQAVFCEPEHRGGFASAGALHAVGFSTAADIASIQRSIDDMVTAWPTTEVHLALTNYQNQDTGKSDTAVTIQIASYGRGKYARHFVIGWNGVRDPLPPAPYLAWIAANSPADGQTATPARIGNPLQAVSDAFQTLHYGSIEISGDSQLSQFTPSNIAPLQAGLATNAATP
jgi:hypothetical protein